MRHLFDQFQQPENRLTHALACALTADQKLLNNFVRWTGDSQVHRGRLVVVEQTLPGEEALEDEEELERRSLPDAWIHNGESWALVIESKIASPLLADQLRRHRQIAKKRGFAECQLLALVVEPPKNPIPDVRVETWASLYKWLKLQGGSSEWASQVSSYMEVLERKLLKDEYLKGGTLTVFAGIPFGRSETAEPYSYSHAKQLLRLAMDEMRKRSDLQGEFGITLESVGRGKITGSGSSAVWDYLPLSSGGNGKNFTQFPHLTLGIHSEYLHVLVIVPNGIRGEFRKNLLRGGREEFIALFAEVTSRLGEALEGTNGAAPIIEIVQRRYPSVNSEPFRDAVLEFDLRTAFGDTWGSRPLKQPEWLDVSYDVLSKRRSNLQLAVGARFDYDRCAAVDTPEILNQIAETWIACKPIIVKMGVQLPTP
jgi:hypothetical protein